MANLIDEQPSRFSVSLAQSDRDQLDAIRLERGCSLADLVREAVRFWLRAQQSRERVDLRAHLEKLGYVGRDDEEAV